MIPKASGKTAPPTPWIARPAISSPIECESAQTSEPRAKTTSVDEQHPLLAEHVAEAADDRRRDRRGQQVGGEHEGDRGRRGAEVLLDRGQRRGDHRLRERVGERAQDEHAEREVVVLALGGRSRRQLGRSSDRARRALRSRPRGAARGRRAPATSNTAWRFSSTSFALALEQLAAAGGQLNLDDAAVRGRGAALDDPLALEPVEHPRRGRLRDPGRLGERARPGGRSPRSSSANENRNPNWARLRPSRSASLAGPSPGAADRPEELGPRRRRSRSRVAVSARCGRRWRAGPIAS